MLASKLAAAESRKDAAPTKILKTGLPTALTRCVLLLQPLH